MDIVRINEDLLQVGDKVRIERGPERKTETATEDLLNNDVTATHYAAGAPDADGNAIVIGQPMVYVDWLGPRGFYIFQKAGPGENDWQKVEYVADEGIALAKAGALAQQLG